MKDLQQPGVGYRKPPKQFQFRKGVSGNPNGKKRGTTRQSLDDVIRREAARLTAVELGGKTLTMRADAALARSLVAQAMKGNANVVRLVFGLLGQKESENKEVAAAHAEERARRERERATFREIADSLGL